jgi:excisionase family DNA binding protein
MAHNASNTETVLPLAVTITRACQLTGLGQTTIWGFLRNGRLEAIRVPGIRRTLIAYRSLAELLSLAASAPAETLRQRKPP